MIKVCMKPHPCQTLITISVVNKCNVLVTCKTIESWPVIPYYPIMVDALSSFYSLFPSISLPLLSIPLAFSSSFKLKNVNIPLICLALAHFFTWYFLLVWSHPCSQIQLSSSHNWFIQLYLQAIIFLWVSNLYNQLPILHLLPGISRTFQIQHGQNWMHNFTFLSLPESVLCPLFTISINITKTFSGAQTKY